MAEKRGLEKIGVGELDGGRLAIGYLRITPDGVDMGGYLIFNRENAAWLIEKLLLAADDRLPETEGHFDPDHFTVYCSGGDRGRPHCVNVLNRRLGTGPLGTYCGICVDEPDLTREAAELLRRYI